jgi:IclR family pca regulon transcriptional regulator
MMLKLGFSYLSSLSLREVAQPLIDQFARNVHEVCTLSVLEGNEVVYVVRAEVRSPMARGLSIGDRLPAHATSTGHVLMTGLPQAELYSLLANAPFHRYTPYTLCARDELLHAVNTAKEQGWAIASEQIELGVCGFAVPVANEQGRVVAALAISVNLARYAEKDIPVRFLAPLQEIASQLRVAC